MAEDGSIRLPDIILWAFYLNEGDLLTVSRWEDETPRYTFQSYGKWLWINAEGMTHPWFYNEQMLRLPMAAVGPRGTLLLPDEAALALRPGDSLLLVAASEPWDGFTLERAGKRRIFQKLCVHADYVVPVEEGAKLRLPEEVRWVLRLAEGDPLACETSMATADFEPFPPAEPSKDRSVVELGPGGILSLPESLLRDLRPNRKLRLTVSFSAWEPALRLTHHFE